MTFKTSIKVIQIYLKNETAPPPMRTVIAPFLSLITPELSKMMMFVVISARDNWCSGPWLMVVTTAPVSHLVIILSWLTSPRPQVSLQIQIQIVMTGQRTQHCRITAAWLKPLPSIVMTWQKAEVISPLQHNAAWLSAASAASGVWCHDSLQSHCCRHWRPLRDKGQRYHESFPLLKIFRNRTKNKVTHWSSSEASINSSSHWFKLLFCHRRQMNHHEDCHCQWPLRPRLWFSPAWLSGAWAWCSSRVDKVLTSGTIRRRVTSRNLNHNHCSRFCRILK